MLTHNSGNHSSHSDHLVQVPTKKRFRFIKFEQDGLIPASLQCCALDAGDGKQSTIVWKEQLVQGGRRLYDLTMDDHFKNREGAVIDFGVKMISLASQRKDLWLRSFAYVYDDNWPWTITVSVSGDNSAQRLEVTDYTHQVFAFEMGEK